MEWIKDYWFAGVIVFVAAMFLFGHKTKGSAHDHQHEPDAGGKEHKSGGGCCH